VQTFVNMRFEPSGITNDTDIRFASSLMDYIFRRLALEYLPLEQREALGIKSVEERKQAIDAGGGSASYAPAEPAPAEETTEAPQLIQVGSAPESKAIDAPLCYSCGSKMQPAGSCYVCNSCGSTSGCS
jgi:ribonucleoside-diphosphate reductase alpha chain